MGVEKTAWNILKTVGGFVVGAVTVFGWLKVSPEMVGQTTYDAMRGPAPLVVMFVSGSLFGWGVTKLWSDRRMKEASEAHDAEIASLRKTKHEHDTLFKKFRDLTHDEQSWVVNVLISEPDGLAPNNEHRAHMGDWVKMKDFLRHDPVGNRLHLVDGVREMLLENPQHVYDLMAARVADLEAELERRPTPEEVDARVVDATAAKCDELSKTPDDRLRERMASGEVSGFEARVLGEVLALDVPARRWLRTAHDEGFVDVEDRALDAEDRLGHFRNLVTAAETGLTGNWGHPATRYVLNDGVRDALEALPGAFDVVDEEDRRVAELAEAWNGRPYDPCTARYKRVSKVR